MDEERFLTECEKSFFKLRLDMLDEEEDAGGGLANETEEDKKENARIEKAAEMAAIEARTVFNEDELRIDYSKKRATDCKHNVSVKLPGPKSEGVAR